MKRIPHAQEVDHAIRGVQAVVKETLRGVNAAAAQMMVKGNYPSAESLVAKGREIQAFHAEVDNLRRRWREVRRSSSGSAEPKKPTSPLWVYYQPILKALVEVGGEARREELEPVVERIMRSMFQTGDHDVMARGLTRWQQRVRRARKELVAEGWLEDASGAMWRITATGRRSAKKPVKPSKVGPA